MKKSDFKGIKGYCLDYNSLSVGGHTFTVKNVEEVVGHDDSIPYIATLYVDNKKLCTLHNDG